MSAVISDCGRYRYHLTRDLGNLGAVGPPLTFVMLNPSTADAEVNDPTIRKCIGFANRIGRFWSISVVNLFAYRATNPAELLLVDDPIGPENEFHLRNAIDSGGPVIVAWGAAARARRLVRPRAERLLELVAQSNTFPRLRSLGRNIDGYRA